MTQEEKAKAYDEAIERAKKHCADYVVETIFPELKESDDERIRKAIGELMHDTTGDSLWIDYGVHKEEALAWLERQGEKKPTEQCDTNKEFSEAVSEKIRNMVSRLFNGDGNITSQKPAWSEEDESMLKTIFDSLNTYAENGNPCLKSVVKDEIDWLKSLKDRVQPKQEWSEEDERERKRVIGLLEGWLSTFKETCYAEDCKCGINWLKSLRPQNRWKPSDEQMITLRHVISGCSYDIDPLVELETKLKEL